jgi:hypothetical protein
MGINRTTATTAILVTVFLTGVSVVSAQNQLVRRPSDRVTPDPPVSIESEVIYSSDGVAYDGFGFALASDGDLLVVGGPDTDDETGLEVGGAWIYERTPQGWANEQKLMAVEPPPLKRHDSFGFRVAVSDDQVFIAVPWETVETVDRVGTVRAFSFMQNENAWTEDQRIVAPTVEAASLFGSEVAVQDNLLVICAPNEGQSGQGKCHIYTRDGNEWFPTQTISPNQATPGQGFGTSTALSGTTLAVGSPSWADGSNYATGMVHVYGNSGGSWVLEQEIESPQPQWYAHFGLPVVISGDTMYVGATGYDLSESVPDVGTVYVYQRSGGTWNYSPATGQILPVPVAEPVNWGRTIATIGDTVFIGDPGASDRGEIYAGMVYPFELAGGQWQLSAEPLTPSTPVVSSTFSRAMVAASGTLFVGSPYSHSPVNDFAGTVHIFPIDPRPVSARDQPGPVELVPPSVGSAEW